MLAPVFFVPYRYLFTLSLCCKGFVLRSDYQVASYEPFFSEWEGLIHQTLVKKYRVFLFFQSLFYEVITRLPPMRPSSVSGRVYSTRAWLPALSSLTPTWPASCWWPCPPSWMCSQSSPSSRTAVVGVQRLAASRTAARDQRLAASSLQLSNILVSICQDTRQFSAIHVC